MVTQYIPALIVIGAAIAAYQFFELNEYLIELVKTKELRDHYDYIIGNT